MSVSVDHSYHIEKIRDIPFRSLSLTAAMETLPVFGNSHTWFGYPGPGIVECGGRSEDCPKVVKKVFPVLIISENPSAPYPHDNHEAKRSRDIQYGLGMIEFYGIKS